MNEKSYKEILPQIKALIFDIDGVLTNGKVVVTTEGEMLREMSIKDGYAIKHALENDFTIGVISGGANEGIKIRLRELGIHNIYLGIRNKQEAYEDFLYSYDLKPEEILYIGDDIPDLVVMTKIGLPCCPSDASPDVKAVSSYVSHKKGGEGCVRDVIEQVLRVQGKWMK